MNNNSFTLFDGIRLIFMIGVAYFLVQYFPLSEVPASQFENSPVSSIVLFVFLAGFLITRAIDRKRKLRFSASMELSRLRRIGHLTEQVPKHKTWVKEVAKYLKAYVRTVGKNDFLAYPDLQKDFRKLSHTIYNFNPKTAKDRILYDEFLDVMKDAAFHRQQVILHMHSNISPYIWLGTAILLVINVWSALLMQEPYFASFVFTFSAVLGLIIVFDILVKLDFLHRFERRDYQVWYKEEAKKMVKHIH
jgi:hypothetical protein